MLLKKIKIFGMKVKFWAGVEAGGVGNEIWGLASKFGTKPLKTGEKREEMKRFCLKIKLEFRGIAGNPRKFQWGTEKSEFTLPGFGEKRIKNPKDLAPKFK